MLNLDDWRIQFRQASDPDLEAFTFLNQCLRRKYLEALNLQLGKKMLHRCAQDD
eukprot:UN13191